MQGLNLGYFDETKQYLYNESDIFHFKTCYAGYTLEQTFANKANTPNTANIRANNLFARKKLFARLFAAFAVFALFANVCCVPSFLYVTNFIFSKLKEVFNEQLVTVLKGLGSIMKCIFAMSN